MYASRLDLPDHVRKGSITLLQARLSDAIDLEAQMKQAHWNVKGRDFFQLHELFDKIHGEVENSSTSSPSASRRWAASPTAASKPRPRNHRSMSTRSKPAAAKRT